MYGPGSTLEAHGRFTGCQGGMTVRFSIRPQVEEVSTLSFRRFHCDANIHPHTPIHLPPCCADRNSFKIPVPACDCSELQVQVGSSLLRPVAGYNRYVVDLLCLILGTPLQFRGELATSVEMATLLSRTFGIVSRSATLFPAVSLNSTEKAAGSRSSAAVAR